MEIAQLRYFLVAAEEENLSSAARKLFISQPALSRSISKLEEELGVKLFHHNSNRIMLNENGRAFIEYLLRAKQELQNGISMLQQRQDRETGYIAISTSSHGLLAEPCAEYLKAHPNTHLMQYIQSAAQMETTLRRRNIDYCITTKVFEAPDIEWIPIMEDEFMVYVHKDNPLSQRTSIDFSELKNERLIFYDYGLETTDILTRLCYTANFDPDLLFAGNENEVPYFLLEKNLGAFVLPASMHFFHMSEMNMRSNDSVLRTLRIREPRVPFTLGLAYLKGRVLQGAAMQFKDYLIDFFCQRKQMLKDSLAREFPLI